MIYSVFVKHIASGDLFELPFLSVNAVAELNNGATGTYQFDFMTIKEDVADKYGILVKDIFTSVLSEIWVQDEDGNILEDTFGIIADYQRTKDADANFTLTIAMTSYFSLLQKRRTGANDVFSGIDPASIPWSLINASQTSGIAGADLGITEGSTDTTGLSVSVTYNRSDIKQAISDLSNLRVAGSFDFDIDVTKNFNVYAPTKGSVRANVVFDANTTLANSVDIPLVLTLTNRAIVRGQGINTDVAESVRIASDPTIEEYTLLEDVVTDTQQSDTTVLAAEGDKFLDLNKLPLTYITLKHGDDIDVGSYGLGDTVVVDIPEEGISYSQFRVKKRTLDIDKTSTIIATLDLLTI